MLCIDTIDTLCCTCTAILDLAVPLLQYCQTYRLQLIDLSMKIDYKGGAEMKIDADLVSWFVDAAISLLTSARNTNNKRNIFGMYWHNNINACVRLFIYLYVCPHVCTSFYQLLIFVLATHKFFVCAVGCLQVFNKSAYVAVTVQRITGLVRLQFTRTPSTYWSFTFYEVQHTCIQWKLRTMAAVCVCVRVVRSCHLVIMIVMRIFTHG